MSISETKINKPTITYSEDSQGFPSFYSYAAEFLKGMNQYLYSFKRGNLWRFVDTADGYLTIGSGTGTVSGDITLAIPFLIFSIACLFNLVLPNFINLPVLGLGNNTVSSLE